MISEFRADELVTNLYTASSTAKRLKPRQIQEWSNRLQRAAPRKRERKLYTYYYVRRHRGRFGRRRRRQRCPSSVFVLCSPAFVADNPA